MRLPAVRCFYASDWQTAALCSQPVRSFICYQTGEHGVENELTDSNANWRKWSAGQGHETFNFWGQEVKGQGTQD